MSDSTRIDELREEIEKLCGNCDRPDKEELGKIILSSMAFGFSEGLDAPSADRPTWIPCSERLPEIGQKVLASTKKTVFTQVFKGYYSEPNKWAWEHNSVKTIEAWMPLPTEYKGADDED